MSRGHHILFERVLWQASDPNRKLRGQPGLRVPMDTSVEAALHADVATVPPPNDALGRSMLSLYRDTPDDHIGSIYNLITATDEAMRRPQVHCIERQLAELIIASLEAQIPYVKEGLII